MKTLIPTIILLASIQSISHAETAIVEPTHGQFLHVRDGMVGADHIYLRLDKIVAIEVKEKGRGEALQFLVTIRSTAARGGFKVTDNLSYDLTFKTIEDAQTAAAQIMKCIAELKKSK